MEPQFKVGQRVAVNIGGCPGNRAEGVVASIRQLPELITYEINFPEHQHDSRIDTFYMAEYLTPLG